jgi:hypothetical protein
MTRWLVGCWVVMLLTGCGAIRVKGLSVSGSGAGPAERPAPMGKNPFTEAPEKPNPAERAAADRAQRESALAEALAARDVPRIRAAWKAVNIRNGPPNPERRAAVVKALYELDLEALASDLLSEVELARSQKFMVYNCSVGCKDLDQLGTAVGQDKVVAAAKTILAQHHFAGPDDTTLSAQLGLYLLKKNEMAGEGCKLMTKILEEGQTTYAPLNRIGDAKCPTPSKLLGHLMSSDDPEERRLAAWVAGEIRSKDALPLLKRLSEHDQEIDNNLHYPVRDEASNAINKILAR